MNIEQMSHLNFERLDYVAAWLEAGAPERGRVEGFNLGYTIHQSEVSCGTVCCIAGAAIEFFDKQFADTYLRTMEHRPLGLWPKLALRACELLGISYEISGRLFNPIRCMGGQMLMRSGWELVTPQWAGQCVRNFMATGEVDWDKAFRDLKKPEITQAVEMLATA